MRRGGGGGRAAAGGGVVVCGALCGLRLMLASFQLVSLASVTLSESVGSKHSTFHIKMKCVEVKLDVEQLNWIATV